MTGNKFISTVLPVTLFALLAASMSVYGYRQIKSGRADMQPTSTTAVPSPKPTTLFSPTIIGEKTLPDLVAEAKSDLSEQLAISRDEITAKETEHVTWNDSSLGCPEPGMTYLQVLTPGYKIVLEAKGEIYNYHTSLRHVKLCK